MIVEGAVVVLLLGLILLVSVRAGTTRNFRGHPSDEYTPLLTQGGVFHSKLNTQFDVHCVHDCHYLVGHNLLHL